MGNMFLITCVEQWSLKERKQMKWVLWSLSVIPRESFQTRTQGGESQGEPSSVPELKRWTWEFGNIRVRSSQGRVKEKRELQWEISEDLQKHQPPPLHWVFIWVSEHSHEEATWSQGTNNLKEAGRKISRLKWNRNYWCSHQPESKNYNTRGIR